MRKNEILSWIAEAIDCCVGAATLERAPLDVTIVRREGYSHLRVVTIGSACEDGPKIRSADISLTIKIIKEEERG